MGAEKNVAFEVIAEPTTETHLDPSPVLTEKLAAVRRKQVGVAAGTGAGMAVGAFVFLLAVAMLCDWWLDFPLGMRAATLTMILCATGLLAWRYILTPLRHQPDD